MAIKLYLIRHNINKMNKSSEKKEIMNHQTYALPNLNEISALAIPSH